jgi:uncharacterized protein YdaU (DUF1376 family)
MSAPWMPLYVADYLADTAHLSAAEHGAYMLLIMHYWRAGKLPNDEKQLQRIARMTAREWANSRETIAAFFDDGWVHGRIENELAKSGLKSTARAQSGSRGGTAKSLKNKEASVANATILLEQNGSKTLASSSHSQSHITSLRSVKARNAPKPPPKYSPEFELFWDCYPPVANQSKAKASEAFHRLDKPDKATATDGAMALAAWLETEKQRKPDADKFIPHASTWLNGRRWETLLDQNHRARYEQRSEVH